MFRSLKSRIRATMALLILLVLVIAIIGVNAIGALNRAAGDELALVVSGSELSTSLVGTTATEIRATIRAFEAIMRSALTGRPEKVGPPT